MPGIPAQASDIPKKYDVLIATRDGTSLSVKNKDGQSVSVSSLAFIAQSSQGGPPQLEETELQHKGQLVQLSSSNLIDREFDQWPQVTQGDWKGGMLQRVFTETDRYWNGLGILWPVNDWLPQQPLMPAGYRDTTLTTPEFMGTVAGYVDGAGEGYAFEYAVGGGRTLVFLCGSNSPQRFANGGFTTAVQDMAIGHGAIWVHQSDGGGNMRLDYLTASGGVLNSTVLAQTAAGTTTAVAAMATGMVGNQEYVAAVTRKTPAANLTQDTIRLFNVTATGATFTTTSFVDLTLATGWQVTSVTFLGDDLIIALTDGSTSAVMAYNMASATWRTLAELPGTRSILLCAIGGGLFLLVNNAVNATQKAIDLYLLQGSSLQNIGPLIPQLGATVYPFVAAATRPSSFGPYALWAVLVQDTSGGPVTMILYGYDVLRGRLFALQSVASFASQYANAIDTMPIAAFSAMQRAVPTTLNCAWGIAINVTTSAVVSPNNIQEFLMGIQKQAGGSGALLQLPCDITASLTDFTSALPKLYRQVVATFTPIANASQATIALKAWVDQDPGSPNASPDYQTTLVGSSSPGATQLALVLNRMAKKIFHEVTTGGGVWTGAAWVDAPKLVSIAVQAATGWVQTMTLALTPNVLCNGNVDNEYCFPEQGVDQVVAYNFLKQLWRQKGGQISVTLPNGDTGNWLLQDMQFESPKFVSQSSRSDKQTMWQGMCTLKMREDV